MRWKTLPLVAMLALAAGCQTESSLTSLGATDDSPRMYEGFDGYTRNVSTNSPEDQRCLKAT